jgi:hypothetical protein
MRNIIICLIFVFVDVGCSGYAVSKYGVSVENVIALKKWSASKISVARFTATGKSTAEFSCRLVGPVATPDQKPFEEYIRNALIDELRVAEFYAETGPVRLTGNLDKIDFSSGEGTWTLGLSVKSSNGHSVTVSIVHKYDSAFSGEKACALSAQAFAPAVQALIGALVANPGFGALVGAPAGPAVSANSKLYRPLGTLLAQDLQG